MGLGTATGRWDKIMGDLCAQRKQFDHDGYAIYEDVLDAELVAEASGHVDW